MLSKTISIGRLQFRFNWIITTCVLLAIGGLLRLGVWQMNRAQEKIELQNNYRDMQQMAPSEIENVPIAGRQFDSIQLQNRQVSLTGTYLNEKSLFRIYQSFEEQIGFEIVTPFALSSKDEIILVSRGWTGAASYEALRDKLPAIEGEQTLHGQIYVPRAAEAEKRNDIADIKWPLLIRHLNSEELQPLFSSPLFPYVVRLNKSQSGVLVRHWPEVHVDTGRNFSYALQWFSMAIALGLVSLILGSNILALLGQRANRP